MVEIYREEKVNKKKKKEQKIQKYAKVKIVLKKDDK